MVAPNTVPNDASVYLHSPLEEMYRYQIAIYAGLRLRHTLLASQDVVGNFSHARVKPYSLYT